MRHKPNIIHHLHRHHQFLLRPYCMESAEVHSCNIGDEFKNEKIETTVIFGTKIMLTVCRKWLKNWHAVGKKVVVFIDRNAVLNCECHHHL